MLLPKFDFFEPSTLAEACQTLAEFGDTAKLIAGGTDLMVNMKKGDLAPDQLISIARIEDLKQVETANGTIRIGAGVAVSQIIESKEIRQKLSALTSSAENLGTPLVRNRATIGGNIGSARPAADIPPALMAYNAQLVLKSKSDQRTLPINDFFKGPGITVLRPDEILVEIVVDTPPPSAGAGYSALGVRKAADCNIVNITAYLSLEDSTEVISTARIVMGCVGPTQRRSPSAEKNLIGQKPSESLFEQAGDAAIQDSSPIDDYRGSALYKKAMVKVLTKRALQIAYAEAKNRV